LTSALDPSNSPEQVQAALESIQKGFLDAHATATAAAGKPLAGALVGHGDRTFLDSKSPYYNGATEEAPPTSAAPTPTSSSGVGAPPVPGAKKASDGNWYVPDPSRPGKYLRVE
jgi:hypothetical protein